VLLPVEAAWLGGLRPGDDLLLADCRGMDRRLRVVAVDAQGVLAESRSTAYVESGAAVRWEPACVSSRPPNKDLGAGRIGTLSARDQPLVLHRGDLLVVIVLKVETRAAFERLPNLLVTALRSPPVGVMVARGDLAVEMGFERLAEVQEQILWLCEAAHVPVIWATQVLESLAKKGMPSRAEVTDAAMSGRAECVMLNKGPHVLDAVRFLDNVMTRMQRHQAKKRAVLRKLSVSDRIVAPRTTE
jgi:hypothetical protein